MLVNGETLKIDYPYYNNYRRRVHIIITMPELLAAAFDGGAYGSISGFQQPVSFAVSLSGNANFNITTNPVLMNVDVSGNSRLSATGTAASIIANISGQARFNGYELKETDTAAVKASGQSSVYINAGKVFTTDASGQSKIYYKGPPIKKNITQTGMAKVINE